MTHKLIRFPAYLTCLIVLGTSVLGQESINRDRINRSTSLTEAESLSRAFQAATAAVLPSVVKIHTVSNNSGKHILVRGLYPLGLPDQEGLGSGVIIDPTGIIMTNNHVVQDADEIIVVLHDGTELHATEYTTDPLTDLAIVRVRTKNQLTAVRLGDSDALKIGDWVLAVGHPLELETSVSAGIISAKGRSLSKVPRAQFLQTDAAINPGNSGGPLVNLRGEVIGINTAIASQTGGYQGIGFAIPANLARHVVGQLRDHGTVTRSYLGVVIQDLTHELSEQLVNRPSFQGIVVNKVTRNTPADHAGVRPGDVITHFAGYPVDSPSTLQRAVERVPVGSKKRLNFIRYGKPMTATVSTLRFDEKQFDEKYQGVTKRLSMPVTDNSTLGFEVADLADLAHRQGYSVDGNAVVITRVARNGLAADKKLRTGMIVKQVRNRNVESVDEFYEALRNESLTKGILLLVRDTSREGDGSDRFVVIRAYQ